MTIKELQVRTDRFEVLISGPSGCGKTKLAQTLLRDRTWQRARVDKVTSINTATGEVNVEYER